MGAVPFCRSCLSFSLAITPFCALYPLSYGAWIARLPCFSVERVVRRRSASSLDKYQIGSSRSALSRGYRLFAKAAFEIQVYLVSTRCETISSRILYCSLRVELPRFFRAGQLLAPWVGALDSAALEYVGNFRTRSLSISRSIPQAQQSEGPFSQT